VLVFDYRRQRTATTNRDAIACVTRLRQTRRGIIKPKSSGDHIAALLGDER